jgi:hypothetical protein
MEREGDSKMEISSPVKLKNSSLNCRAESGKPYIFRYTILILSHSKAGTKKLTKLHRESFCNLFKGITKSNCEIQYV